MNHLRFLKLTKSPGTIHHFKIFHLLTLDELINVIPRRMIIPRTFITYEGDSILIGGIGRVDLLAAKSYNDQLAAVFVRFDNFCLRK